MIHGLRSILLALGSQKYCRHPPRTQIQLRMPLPTMRHVGLALETRSDVAGSGRGRNEASFGPYPSSDSPGESYVGTSLLLIPVRPCKGTTQRRQKENRAEGAEPNSKNSHSIHSRRYSVTPCQARCLFVPTNSVGTRPMVQRPRQWMPAAGINT